MKQMIQTFLIMALLSSPVTSACIAPSVGAMYDALIEVEKVGENTFTVTIPKSAYSLKYGARINLVYYASSDDRKLQQYWQVIETIEQDSSYVGTFTAFNIPGYLSFVEVFWEPEAIGLCGAYGSSEDLDLS